MLRIETKMLGIEPLGEREAFRRRRIRGSDKQKAAARIDRLG